MAETLFLIETRAKYDYICSACQKQILRGSRHFRHDPHPHARIFRGQMTSHWCAECIEAVPTHVDRITKRRRIRITSVRPNHLVEPVQVEVIQIGRLITQRLVADPREMHQLTPDQFEEFVCDRLYAMGFEPKRVGAINRKDGGLDVLFWPRLRAAFPFLGAAQIKHHRNPKRREGPETVRELAGAIAGHPISAALLITNTAFTPDAKWFAKERTKLIRLRGFDDMKRWIAGQFEHSDEWREIPTEIEICPGVVVPIRSAS